MIEQEDKPVIEEIFEKNKKITLDTVLEKNAQIWLKLFWAWVFCPLYIIPAVLIFSMVWDLLRFFIPALPKIFL